MAIKQQWRPIKGLSRRFAETKHPELDGLRATWYEQAEILMQEGIVPDFMAKLKREWAIETGIPEGLYTVDPVTTEKLIEQGLNSKFIPHGAADLSPEKLVTIMTDHIEALDGVFAFVVEDRPLTIGYIKELHAQLTRHQETVAGQDTQGRLLRFPLDRGEFKKLPNNSTLADGRIHQYCPPEQTVPQMERLVRLHKKHEDAGIRPEISAAWLHHAFTRIHPFQDGNGRVARALASMVFIKVGMFPLTLLRMDREEYIDALEIADEGDLVDLSDLFALVQSRIIVCCLNSSRTVPGKKKVHKSAVPKPARRPGPGQAKGEQWNLMNRHAQALIETSGEILGEMGPIFSIVTESPDKARYAVETLLNGNEDRLRYFRDAIADSAAMIGYHANMDAYHGWSLLTLSTDFDTHILLAIHCLGPEFRGVFAGSMTYIEMPRNGRGNAVPTRAIMTAPGLFQFNVYEPMESVLPRFSDWMRHGVIEGFRLWMGEE